MHIIQTYLKKRGIIDPWKIDPKPNKKFHQAVVIPAYGELELLPKTLQSLNTNNISILKDTLVVVVVNHGQNSPTEIKQNNQSTLQMLHSQNSQFTLGIIDAVSNQLEFPTKHTGVGLARKIGMDLALPHLSSVKSLIFCTDADTVVSKDYIEKVITYFNTTNMQAAVVGFRHLESNDQKQEEAIRKYETYLLRTAEKLRNAGSPYGYVAMGSTMVCTAGAYCSIGGMPRKKATEDFYFLQELSKYCNVHIIPNILVYPSPREISRVYLGTGFHMKEVQEGFDVNTLYYSDTAFRILSIWLELGSNAWEMELSVLRKKTSAIHPQLMDFLLKEGIESIWRNLQGNAPSKSHFTGQFHRWFDGLKTVRFLKHFSKII